MLTLLHTVYSKIRMEAWGCYAAFEQPRRYKKCKSHDGQLWHSNCKRIYILSMTPNKNRKGYFLERLKKKLTKTSFLHWPTTKHWIPPPFLFPPLKFQKSFPPLTLLFEIVVPFTEQGKGGWGESYAICSRCALALPPENIRKPYGFLIFSVVRERVHWERMG